MDYSWYIYLIVFVSGIFCGLLNTVAGGGSFITLPVLMSIGLPDIQANVTNRLGFLAQSVVAIWGFKKRKTFEWKWGLQPAIPLVAGTLIGAFIAVHVQIGVIRTATGILLLCMLPFLFLQPEKWLNEKVQCMPRTKWWIYAIYFFLGIYAGFLQAGIGYFLLFLFVLGAGCDLLTANSLKVLVVFFITIAGLVVFLCYSGKVPIRYDIGLTQACGQAAGAYLGVRFAVRFSPRVIRYVLISILLIFAGKMLLFP